MTVPEQIIDAVDKGVGAFGAVDILVNNAGGLISGSPQPFDALSDDDFIRSYILNTMSAVRFTRAVLPTMREKAWGRIVSVSSETPVQPNPVGADYSAGRSLKTSRGHTARALQITDPDPSGKVKRNAGSDFISFQSSSFAGSPPYDEASLWPMAFLRGDSPQPPDARYLRVS